MALSIDPSSYDLSGFSQCGIIELKDTNLFENECTDIP